MKKITIYANIIAISILILGLMVWCFLKPTTELSTSERRKLTTFPEWNWSKIISGNSEDTFMGKFEKYAADQFPLREQFRAARSQFATYCLGQKEVNDIVCKDGYLAKLEPEINEADIDYLLDRFADIKDMYLGDNQIYFALIPDKGYYLSDEMPYLDFEKLSESMKAAMPYAKQLDLKEQLSLDNYYLTDTHWKQESLKPVADYILQAMDMPACGEYETKSYSEDFAGVFYGQAALPVKKDTMNYLWRDEVADYTVKIYDSGDGVESKVYDFEKAEGLDMYELFLSGSKALVTIENPASASDKELILFRDSFGSSMAPLLAHSYRKITLVDIRYMSPSLLGRFIDFDGKDVLFMYSVAMMNHSVGQVLK